MNKIDIHNHIAWNVDDGIETKENANLALINAYKDDIHELIVTPHFVPGRQNKEDVIAINARICDLQLLGQNHGIKIHHGSEVFLNDDYLEMIDQDLCNTLADSSYLLCEFDVRKDIKYNEEAEDKLYELYIRELIPVVAHVERYFHSELDLHRVQDWIDSGYVIQVNRTSFIGSHGKQAQDNAFQLLRAGMVHVIASDAHRTSGSRILQLSDVYDIVKDEVGEANAQLLFYKNPKHIINNEEIEDMVIEKKKKSSWFSRFRRG